MLFKNTDKFFYPTPLGVDTGGEVEGEEREFYKTDLRVVYFPFYPGGGEHDWKDFGEKNDG